MDLYWHNLNSNNDANDRSNYSTDITGLIPALIGLMDNDDLFFNGSGIGSDANWTLSSSMTVNSINFTGYTGLANISSHDLIVKSDTVIDTNATYSTSGGELFCGSVQNNSILLFGGTVSPTFTINIEVQNDINLLVTTGTTLVMNGSFDSVDGVNIVYGDLSGTFNGSFIQRMSTGGASFTHRTFNNIDIISGIFEVDYDRSVVQPYNKMIEIDLSGFSDGYTAFVIGENISSTLGWSGVVEVLGSRSGGLLVRITSSEIADDVVGINQTLTTSVSGIVLSNYSSQIINTYVYSSNYGKIVANDNTVFGFGFENPVSSPLHYIWAVVEMKNNTELRATAPNTNLAGDLIINGITEITHVGVGFNNGVRFVGNRVLFAAASVRNEIKWNVNVNGNYLWLSIKQWEDEPNNNKDIYITMDTSHNNAQFVLGDHMHGLNENTGLIITSNDAVNADSRCTVFAEREDAIPIKRLTNVIFRTTVNISLRTASPLTINGTTTFQIGNGSVISYDNTVTVNGTLRFAGESNSNNINVVSKFNAKNVLFQGDSVLATTSSHREVLIPKITVDTNSWSINFANSAFKIFVNELDFVTCNSLTMNGGDFIMIGDTNQYPKLTNNTGSVLRWDGTSGISDFIWASKSVGLPSGIEFSTRIFLLSYGRYDGVTNSKYNIDGINMYIGTGSRPVYVQSGVTDLEVTFTGGVSRITDDFNFEPENDGSGTGGTLIVNMVNHSMLISDSLYSRILSGMAGTHEFNLNNSKIMVMSVNDYSGIDFGDFSSPNEHFSINMENYSLLAVSCDFYGRYIDVFDSIINCDDSSFIAFHNPSITAQDYELYFRDRNSINNNGLQPNIFNLRVGEFLDDVDFLPYNGNNTGTKLDPIHVSGNYSQVFAFDQAIEDDGYLYFQVDGIKGQEIRVIDTGDDPDSYIQVYTDSTYSPSSILSQADDDSSNFQSYYEFPATRTYWVRITEYSTKYTEDKNDNSSSEYELVLQNASINEKMLHPYVGFNNDIRAENYRIIELNEGQIEPSNVNGNTTCNKLVIRNNGGFLNANGKTIDVNEIVKIHNCVLEPDSGTLNINCSGRVVQGTVKSISEIKNINFASVVNAVRVRDGGGNTNLHIRRS